MIHEKKHSSKDPSVGVVVGRWQTHNLTLGHNDIIDHAINNHEKVIIFIGLAPIKSSIVNPLDLEARRGMIKSEYPSQSVEVRYIKDQKKNAKWSKDLDMQIEDSCPPSAEVMLYGSRDSFIKTYSGRYPTTVFESKVNTSATQVRKLVGTKTHNSAEFRAGVINGSQQRYPTSFQTVDIGIIRRDENGKPLEILLGRKDMDDNEWRFPGGFVQPQSDLDPDDYLEANALREVKEECGINLEVSKMTYVCSRRVDDWRYRSEIDEICTALFTCDYVFGSAEANDDLDEVKWFPLDGFDYETIMVEGHRPLMKKLLAKI